jgi:acyl-[acyl-carrier-protein]-phospholipid O-acyltransferase / long-chain-fatty-acid--[acyl-carrier-protein] ligase
MNRKTNFYKQLVPLCVPQTLGVFNDNAFKSVVIFTALGLSNDYGYNAFLMALMTIVYVLPFLIFVVPAGFTADRYSKRKVMIGTKFAEFLIMLLGAFFLFKIKEFGIYPLVFILFLMAMQSAFFSPSFYGILPEVYEEKEISRANGILGMFSFIGIITGFAMGIIVKSLSGERLYLCGLFLSVIAVVGFLFSLKIEKTNAGNKVVEWNKKIFKEFKKTFIKVKNRKDLFISILGEAYFYAFGASMQTILVLYGKYILHLKTDLEIGFLQFIIAIGMAVGCVSGGKLSRNKLELGLPLYGGLSLVLLLILTVFVQGGEYVLVIFNTSFVIYPLQMFFLFCFGIAGGIFVIPLRVCQQERTKITERGQIIAFSNFCIFISIFASGVITFMLTGGYKTQHEATFVNNLYMFKDFIFKFSPSVVLLVIAGLTLVLCLISIFIHKEFLYRSISIFITRFLYKVRVIGSDNVPFNKPTIFVSNHVTLIDEFFINSAVSKNIKFVTYKDSTQTSFYKKTAKFFRYIKKPEYKNINEYKNYCDQIENILKSGRSVCVFPERKITKNGLMGSFSDEIKDILPDDLDVAVIPVYIGPLWGSKFSYCKCDKKLRPRLISVCFGKEINKNSKPYEIRQYISELAVDVECLPRYREKPLHYNFIHIAKRNPFKKILFDYKGGALNSFKVLLISIILSREINKIKSKNKYIGILLPNSNFSAATILAVMFSDLVPSILNFSLSEKIFNYSVKKANLDTIITSRLFIQKANLKERPEMVFLEDISKNVKLKIKIFYTVLIFILPSWILIRCLSKNFKDIHQTAILLFSSGSSGIPKGILLSHHNMNSDVNSYIQVMKCSVDNEKIVGNLPFFHSFGINLGFWIPLMYGLKIVYIKNPLDTSAVIQSIKKHKLTLLASTPTFLNNYIKKSTNNDYDSLRLLILGSEKMNYKHAENFKKYAYIEPLEGYGCTELSPVVSINISENVNDLGLKSGKSHSIGKVLTGMASKIIDIDTHKEVKPGNSGLLFIKSPTIMKGYLDDINATNDVIINGWYNTKDIAYMDEEGYIVITGRISRFSKIAGEMVSHEIIEKLINEADKSEYRTIFVSDIKDDKKGEKLIVMYTELNTSINKINMYLKNQGLPNLWIPKQVNYYKVDKIPILGSGKLDLLKLKKLAVSVAS